MIKNDTHIIYIPKPMLGLKKKRISLSERTIYQYMGAMTDKILLKANTTKKDLTVMKFRKLGIIEIYIK